MFERAGLGRRGEGGEVDGGQWAPEGPLGVRVTLGGNKAAAEQTGHQTLW